MPDVIHLQVNAAKFDRAIEQRFKPAIRKAIAEVFDAFLDDVHGDFIEVVTPKSGEVIEFAKPDDMGGDDA